MSVNPITANGSPVARAIAAASRQTGMDFDYLMGQAQVESGMRADARAGTSSASGLYQFIEQSWLSVVKQHGAEHGLGWAAASIDQTSGGRYTVGDSATRQAILDLRNDPRAASLMAAEHAADNKVALEASLGREATGTDLYMAHFLGLNGARSFLSTMSVSPDRTGASMFPAAARANRNIFYAPSGQPRTLADIYQRFASKLDNGAAAVGATGLASDALDRAPGFVPGNPSVEVVLGNRAVGGDRQWLATTLAQLSGDGSDGTTMDALSGAERMAADWTTGSALSATQTYRPTPETARLAYLMLASLGT
ncbi:lytic transglycosylase domain-containing protein [Stakelama saccharophila]|uniref:Lytic transglycosylase domain-containing protein n=1 Tax=Stakelama saccharophila TaxID=3075605 RepID=A0ABZ0B8F8_9SPHN|nr:lytic transglycosylase domain-containing protein [Stakelama sp. W311]WNO53684.1 lytic transglycosylase domain-containing protein [Stakelama sp. W311]